MQFRTFPHAWFAGLLRNAPLAVLRELGLPSNYELLEDDAEARSRTRRPFFEAVTADPDALADFSTRWSPATAARRPPRRSARRFHAARGVLAGRAGRGGAAFRTTCIRRWPASTRPTSRCAARPCAGASGSTARPRLGRETNKTPQKVAEAVIDIFGTGEPPPSS